MTPYWIWVKSEADAIDTDGCTGVTGVKIECCYQHDIQYFYAKDPRDAYRRWCANDPLYWQHARDIDREEADADLRQCHRNRSAFGNWSPMALWRWVVVRWKGQDAWDTHRAREREQRVGAEPV